MCRLLPVAGSHSDKKPRAIYMHLRMFETHCRLCCYSSAEVVFSTGRLRAGTRPTFPMKPGMSPKMFGKR